MKAGDSSGGIFAAIGITLIVLGEYPVVLWFDRYWGWSLGLIFLAISTYFVLQLIDHDFEEEDAIDEEWLDPYN